MSFCSIETCSRTLDYPIERSTRRCVEHMEGLAEALAASDADALRWLITNWSRFMGPIVFNDPWYNEKMAALEALKRVATK